MTTTPAPSAGPSRRTDRSGADAADVVAALRREGVNDVDTSTLARALYASDASLHRVPPEVVARPHDPDELRAVVAVARQTGMPLTMRGAGTSIAGNAVGPGIVVDTVKHMNRVHEIDPEARTARVEPGTIHATLQRAATPHGLRYGPDPSTHTRCTIGGMLGNNACGSRALGYGRAADNVADLTAVLGTGEELPSAADALGRLVDDHLAHVRTSFGTFSRQVSGYSLEHLLPEQGRNLEKFLVGSEGTLGVMLEATVDLVVDDPVRTLVVLGYPSMAEAADAVPGLLASGVDLVACEGLDARIVDIVRARRGSAGVPDLPRGGGWLFAETTCQTEAEAAALAQRIASAADCLDHRHVTDTREAAALWQIREEGAGLAARSLTRPAYSGWEDAAVPPEHLGAWLRDFDEMLTAYGLDGIPYGHFGDGCVHARIDFTFDDGGEAYRDFLTACAHRLTSYGGSLSGEHGDGRTRSELLQVMYDAQSLSLFEQVKGICDPDGVLNPGVIADPVPLDSGLRPARPRHEPLPLLRFTHDDGSLGDAVHRCTGVGKCVAGPGAGVMCPSHAATRDEKDSTRGRARVLQEAIDGELVDGLADPAVSEALDLCLSCKGCLSDCPTGIDMATYKAESLHQQYAGKPRPRSHYTLGQLPRWARLTAPVAGLANKALEVGPLAWVAKGTAGVDQRRALPTFAPESLRRWARRRGTAGERGGTLRRRRRSTPATTTAEHPDVWLWADSFTDYFLPGSARAAVRVLEAAGLTVRVIDDQACCALTWISTGQLTAARRIMGKTVATLAPYVDSGVPVLGLEPSCLATLRSDAVELTDDPAAQRVAEGMLSFAELCERLALPLPDLTGVEVVAQPHCHHHSVIGWETDRRLLERAGASVRRVGGCCGLAGNFGVEKGHYEVSVAVAETQLLPAVREAGDAVVLADGMSCRVQLDDLADVPARHLAELFAERIGA